MTERITFHFDPICPWCYMTSQWIHRLEELGEVEVSWRLFSLEIQNKDEESEEMAAAHARSGLALRTAVMVRDEVGEKGVGAFYGALGRRVHDEVQSLKELSTVQGALEDAGLDPALAEKAQADDGTWDRVVAEHHDLKERTRSFGVPTIEFEDDRAMFGPVISKMPASDEESKALLEHVSWLVRYANFSELKRDRVEPPDTEGTRRRIRERQERREG